LLNKQNPLKVLSTLVAERSKKSKNVELIKLGNLSKWLKNSEEKLFYQPSKRTVQFIQYFSVLLPDKNNCSFQFDHGNTDVDYKQFFFNGDSIFLSLQTTLNLNGTLKTRTWFTFNNINMFFWFGNVFHKTAETEKEKVNFQSRRKFGFY